MIIAKSDRGISNLLPNMLNRHGLISGTTGGGKTVTLRVIAENLSKLGIPCFMADVKGDLSGISTPGKGFEARAKVFDELPDFQHRGYPTLYWDLYGVRGHPIRTPLGSFGPLLTARLLDLNKVQTGVVTLAWRVAREHFPDDVILSLGCLKALLKHLADHAYNYTTDYGNITPSSVGVIQRAILELEEQDVNQFFNLPKFDIEDWFFKSDDGRGVIHLLDARILVNRPRLYATFLLWLLSDLFENLTELGDAEKPIFAFFFDEAHLLFADIPKVLLDKIEQIIRLIRSKGVSIWFITQNALDIPKTVLGQLGNRVQHTMRAFTPEDFNAVRKIAKTFRQNPRIDTVEAITTMGTGEALVSCLQADGSPSPVDRAWIVPPESNLVPLEDAEIRLIVENSPLFGKYENGMFTEEQKQSSMRSRNKATGEEYLNTLGKGMIKTMGNYVAREMIRGIFTMFKTGLRSGVGR